MKSIKSFKKFVRTVKSNIYTESYCHWFSVDEATFREEMKDVPKPDFIEKVDTAITYRKPLESGGVSAVGLEDIANNSYYLFIHNSNQEAPI